MTGWSASPLAQPPVTHLDPLLFPDPWMVVPMTLTLPHGAVPAWALVTAWADVIWIWMENRSYGDIIGSKAQASAASRLYPWVETWFYRP